METAPHKPGASMALLSGILIISLLVFSHRLDSPKKTTPPEIIKVPVVQMASVQLPAPPASKPKEKLATKPKPPITKREIPPITPPEKVTQPTTTDLKKGRSMLKIMEHGKGPTIEIAWPNSANEQDKLYKTLSNCLNVQTVLFKPNGQFYRKDGPANWRPNPDRYSGYMRAVVGHVPQTEKQLINRIRRHNPDSSSAAIVRLFPRALDARLLGGISNIIQQNTGGRFLETRTIKGLYQLDGARLYALIKSIDGKKFNAKILLADTSGHRCH